MGLREWSKAEVEYGRKVLDSGVEGALSGREKFLDGKPMSGFMREWFQEAWKPAALGAAIGVLGSCPGNRKSVGRTVAFGVLGGIIGFAAGLAWDSRDLTKSAVSAALDNIERVRDEHWFEMHPIDYA
jgi:hypothetical protein